MNQHLQKILDFIQQDEKLTAEEKALLTKAVKSTDSELSISEFKLDRTEKVKRTTAILLEETIEELEQKRKAVEAQNRELEIESALEKVRSSALAMKELADMVNVCHLISDQMELLNVKNIRNVQTAIIYETEGVYFNYEYYTKHNKELITEVNFKNHEVQTKFVNKMLKGAEEQFTIFIKDKELKDWYAYQKTTNQFADTYLENAEILCYYWYSLGPVALGISTYVPLTDEEINLFKRFRNVFELAYTRFLDIEKAIAQAKEARLETALERVRAVAMAMRKPEDLSGISETLFTELKALDFNDLRNTEIIINNDSKETIISYYYSDYGRTGIVEVDYKTNPTVQEWVNQLRKTDDAFAEVIIYEKEMEAWNIYMEEIGYKPDTKLDGVKAIYYYSYSIGLGALSISSFTPVAADQIKILERFRNVFNLSYQRYADIALAEAQAKEAQIELALERVRARTMAMQKSEELGETATLLFEQMNALVPDLWSCGFVLCDKNKSVDEWWLSGGNGYMPDLILPNTDDLTHSNIYKAWLQGSSYHEEVVEGDELQKHYEWLMTIPVAKAAFDAQAAAGIQRPVWQQLSCAYFTQGYLVVITQMPCHQIDLFKRFAKVFDQTYTRFLDLQKAEAQAKEAKIEAALEKVRSRSMGMQKSEELKEVIQVVYEQFVHLNVNMEHTGFVIDYKQRDDRLIWVASKYGVPSQLTIPYFDCEYYNCFNEAKEKGQDFFATNLSFENKNSFYSALFKYIPELPEEAREFYFSCPGLAISTVLLDNIGLYIENFEGIPYSDEDNAILMRFGKVFQQTYTRFLDLQKAEAQARESQIEAALEKVRSRSLAMHNSDELVEVVTVVFQKLQELNMIVDGGVTISIYDEVTNDQVHWVAAPELISSTHFNVPYANDKIIADNIKAKKSGIDFFAKTYPYDEKNAMLKYLFEYSDYKKLPEEIKDWVLQSENYSQSIAFSKNSSIFVNSYSGKLLSEDESEILKRFAKVFEQAYIRFLDLQKAEANTREAQIEASLERIRSRTLAMQESDELVETAAELFKQLIHLGISPNRLYIGIIKDETGNIEFWVTDEDGTKVSTQFSGNVNKNASIKKMYTGWQEKKASLHIDMMGKELQDYFHYLADELHVPFKGGLAQTRRIQTVAYFSKGFIGIASPDDQPEETTFLLERFASVFNLTFTRFNDLKIAEAHAEQAQQDLIAIKEAKQKAEDALIELQATQKQLIQSEKMASLGELTAGIAHEIQNPLNFVNNFSEVSKELLDEMKTELDNGNIKDAKEIMADVIQNLEKINHHGKRADAIVKGMLQHSRSSSGQKEPTDINALSDEYLRLSYHGLRAKDKSFNAIFKTDFDDSIGMINVLPQDIGRVILNLLTNAFYVVNERKKLNIHGYEPTVTVSTKKAGGTVEIRVTDNGNGIPQNIVDKIFQPFFTTKPTGQGTGLGLSLSYDIIKAHGGEMKVETKEGEGSEFIISLPVNI